MKEKKLRYVELVAECQEKAWRGTAYPVEVGCCGFVSLSTKRFLRHIGFMSAKMKVVLKDLSEEAEKGSFLALAAKKKQELGELRSHAVEPAEYLNPAVGSSREISLTSAPPSRDVLG